MERPPDIVPIQLDNQIDFDPIPHERQLAFEIMSASSRIEQLTPINFEHFRSQTCSGDASYGSWLHSCERPPLDAEYGLR